jgi:hypothetical protein
LEVNTDLIGELLPTQTSVGAQLFDAVSYPIFFSL